MKTGNGKVWLAAALFSVLMAGTTYAAGWQQTESGWKYANEANEYLEGRWFQDASGTWYHFNDQGIMETGWFQDSDKNWYYLNPENGDMKTGWHQDSDGKWYFLAYSGAMQRGLVEVNGNVYFLEDSGSLFVGQMEIGGVTYNFTENGTTGARPYVSSRWESGGNKVENTVSNDSSEEEVRIADFVRQSVKEAVNKSSDSPSVRSAKISGMNITVMPESENTLLSGLDWADQTFRAFVSSPYVTRTVIAGKGTSAVLYDGETYDLIGAARTLGFKGSDTFSFTKGTYTVTVSFSGTVSGRTQTGDLVYTVSVE